jgi:hypothetical protein
MKYPKLSFTSELLKHELLIDLSDAQKISLLQRLSYVIELCDRLISITDFKSSYGLISDIELDVWICIGAPDSDAKNEVSSWVIHTSWINECDGIDLSKLLEKEITDGMGSKADIESADTLHIWINKQEKLIRKSALNAIAATSISVFIANFMAINILLLNLLSTLSKARLLAQWKLPLRMGKN